MNRTDIASFALLDTTQTVIGAVLWLEYNDRNRQNALNGYKISIWF
jgi:hypothetical protein